MQGLLRLSLRRLMFRESYFPGMDLFPHFMTTAINSKCPCILEKEWYSWLLCMSFKVREREGKVSLSTLLTTRGARGGIECNMPGRCPFFKILHNLFWKKIAFQ